MGVSSSKIEDDKSLILCRERKHFVRDVIDNRCELAATHVAYIHSLRNTGIALTKFVQPEIHSESSLCTTSTSATTEPLALTEKSISQFSNSSPSPSQHAEHSFVYSPTPSPPYSQRFHVNLMKAGKNSSRTVEERLPVSQRVQSSSNLDDLNFEATPPPATPPWDYFDFFNPIDRQFSFQDDKDTSPGFQSNVDISRLREEEGIPDLEDEVEKSSVHERESDVDHFEDTDDEFDNPSSEPLVKMFKNRNEAMNHKSSDQNVRHVNINFDRRNVDKTTGGSSRYESDETSEVTPTKATSSMITVSVNGKYKEFGSETKFRTKDFFSCVKEIEVLFLIASDSGREIPMMLEAKKVQFRPLFHGGMVHKSKLSGYLTAWFTCCIEEPKLPQAPPTTNEVKYLPWHGSVSSRSSSSRNPLAPTSKDEAVNIGSHLFDSRCMNSGSHASTLDRLYAWEKKLYDEIKVSGIIRREYDMKCKLLRDQESREELAPKVEKTRASVKDLHSRIRVAIHRIDSISKRIEEIRDKELHPQLEELIEGLTKMWKMMLEHHKTQHNIITSASKSGTIKLSSTRSEPHRQSALLLQAELHSLHTNFTKWISSHKSYLSSINGWLLKCIFLIPAKQKRYKKNPPSFSFSPRRSRAPPIFVTCRDWLKLIDELPAKEVEEAVNDLIDVTNSFLPRQEKGAKGSEFTVDWSVNYDGLQSGFAVFFDKLTLFAEKSIVKYEELQKTIDEVKVAYDGGEDGRPR